MTNTSRRLRALASSLCQFEGADSLSVRLISDSRYEDYAKTFQEYMNLAQWTGPLAPWRTTVQEELESIYADYQARQAD